MVAMAAMMVKAAALMAKLAAVTEMEAAVYRRGRWFISSVSDVRIMWNITSLGYLNNDHPWSSV
jgi:uncharacterized membrane protein YeiB